MSRRRLPSVIRRVALWMFTGLCIFFALSWVGSAWWKLSYIVRTASSQSEAYLQSGVLSFTRTDFSGVLPTSGFAAGQADGKPEPSRPFSQNLTLKRNPSYAGFQWFYYSRDSSVSRTYLAVPAWLPFALLAFSSGCLGLLHRKLRDGCKRCGYSREGLSVVAVCPECGTAPPVLPALCTPSPHS